MKVVRLLKLGAHTDERSEARAARRPTGEIGTASALSGIRALGADVRIVAADRGTGSNMVSLSATVARYRVVYPRPIGAMPDIVMLKIPPEFRRPDLALGDYHPILVETIDEQHELELFLAQEREAPCAPDLLDGRPSTLQAEHIAIAHYAPPADDWPYALVCRWPPHLAAAAPEELRMFVRGAYTIELFAGREQLEQASERVLALLKRRRTRVEIILPDWSAAPDGTRH